MNDSGALSDPTINMADPFSTMDVRDLFRSLVEEHTPEQHVCHDEHQAYGRYRVNLSTYEDHMLGEVVFTREFFQQVSQIRRSLISWNTNTIYTIPDMDIDDPFLAVRVRFTEYYVIDEDKFQFEYEARILNHVELSPLHNLWSGSDTVILARKYRRASSIEDASHHH
jgi:hypothetical protein